MHKISRMSKKKKRDSEREYEEHKKTLCSHCERPDASSYSRWNRNDPFIRAFNTEMTMSFGDLVSCPKCKSKWMKLSNPRDKNSNYVSLDFISDESVKKLEDWELMDLKVTDEQKKVLKEIGATPPDAYTNGSEFIRFPCKCILKDGRKLDMCILEFRRVMPETDEEDEPIFLNDVKEILPSEYTLSKSVRYATTQAEEIRNSYAPTVVKLPTGGKYIFNWTNHFFATTKIKGSEITQVLKENPFDVKTADEDETGDWIASDRVYIYAHWDEELLEFELNENNLI